MIIMISASGKSVITSEESLSKARVLFESEDTKSNGKLFNPLSNLPHEKEEEDSGDESNQRKRKMESGDQSDEWTSSPTIGHKKKRIDSPSETLLTQTPSSAFDCDPTSVPYEVLSMRKQARQLQKFLLGKMSASIPSVYAFKSIKKVEYFNFQDLFHFNSFQMTSLSLEFICYVFVKT